MGQETRSNISLSRIGHQLQTGNFYALNKFEKDLQKVHTYAAEDATTLQEKAALSDLRDLFKQALKKRPKWLANQTLAVAVLNPTLPSPAPPSRASSSPPTSSLTPLSSPPPDRAFRLLSQPQGHQTSGANAALPAIAVEDHRIAKQHSMNPVSEVESTATSVKTRTPRIQPSVNGLPQALLLLCFQHSISAMSY
jgi:hypothetical protein